MNVYTMLHQTDEACEQAEDIHEDARDRVQLAWTIYRDALLACASGDPHKLRALAERLANALPFGGSADLLARLGEGRR